MIQTCQHGRYEIEQQHTKSFQPTTFAGAHFALLRLLLMSAIFALSAHFWMMPALSLLFCMTAVVAPCDLLYGTGIMRLVIIAW